MKIYQIKNTQTLEVLGFANPTSAEVANFETLIAFSNGLFEFFGWDEADDDLFALTPSKPSDKSVGCGDCPYFYKDEDDEPAYCHASEADAPCNQEDWDEPSDDPDLWDESLEEYDPDWWDDNCPEANPDFWYREERII